MSGTPKPISGIIGKVIGSLGIRRPFHGWMVVSRWQGIVGEHIARNSQAVRFDDGVLYVAVASDTWRQELSLQMDELLRLVRQDPSGAVVDRIQLIRGGKG